MSIWSSINDAEPSDLLALRNDGDAANYRGEGTPGVYVDVATTSPQFHQLIRLALWTNALDVDCDVLLTCQAARRLRDRLNRALGEAS